ncbi:MAG: alkaline phosphatase family protein [bacterium]
MLILFDGLLATELLHQTLDDAPDVDLPALRAVVRDGVAWRYGAVVGFPSVSAPGTSRPAPALAGPPGVVSNAFYSRRLGRPLNPFALIADPGAFLMDPAGARAFYDDAVAPDVETLAQAAHRALGQWDAATGQGAYVAVINELAIGGADWSTLDFLGAGKASLDQYRVADNLAVVQAEQRIGALDAPVPTILQLSWVSTDGAGEGTGPHSPLLRTVLTEMDGRLARLQRALARAGVLDRTLFALVSDHGMELQDRGRAAHPGAIIARSGVRLRFQADGLLYLRTLEADAVPVGEALRVTVRDHDDGAPVAGATVACAGCEAALTDAAGAALVVVGDAATLAIEHPDFNPASLNLP